MAQSSSVLSSPPKVVFVVWSNLDRGIYETKESAINTVAYLMTQHIWPCQVSSEDASSSIDKLVVAVTTDRQVLGAFVTLEEAKQHLMMRNQLLEDHNFLYPKRYVAMVVDTVTRRRTLKHVRFEWLRIDK